METTAADKSLATPAKKVGIVRELLRYALHLTAVYLIVNFTMMRLSSFFHDVFLPLVQQHPPVVSSFQFFFSHLFALSFFTGLAVAFLYSLRYRHYVALFVWCFPAAIVAYKMLTYPVPATSVIFESSGRFEAACHQYFGGNFSIPEFRDYAELFLYVAPNPDAQRGMEQLRFTAPLYAGIGYAVGTWLGIKLPSQRFRSWLERAKP